MQQMPEEIRHLHQRACASQSASHDDKAAAHAWQKCPGDKRLGTRRQRSVHSFSDCTVQYVIDCNRSTSSTAVNVDKASCNLPARDSTSDVTASSPPRKRPHLDLVDFFLLVFFACYFFITQFAFCSVDTNGVWLR